MNQNKQLSQSPQLQSSQFDDPSNLNTPILMGSPTPVSHPTPVDQPAPLPQSNGPLNQPVLESTQTPESNLNNDQLSRTRLSDTEQVDVLCWCLSHRDVYVKENTTFWDNCKEFIKEEFDKDISHPDQMIKGWELRRREEIKAEMKEMKKRKKSGVAIEDTDFRQRISQWVEFIDDLIFMEQERKESGDPNSQQAIAKRARSDMMTGLRDRPGWQSDRRRKRQRMEELRD